MSLQSGIYRYSAIDLCVSSEWYIYRYSSIDLYLSVVPEGEWFQRGSGSRGGGTGEFHADQRHHAVPAVRQCVVAHVAGVHVPDLDPAVLQSHPVVVLRVVLSHRGAITHLHTHAHAHTRTRTHTRTQCSAVQLVFSFLLIPRLSRYNYLSRHLCTHPSLIPPSPPL